MRQRLTTWLHSLTAKYVAVFTLLVVVPSIGLSVYFLNSSYNDNKRALIKQQQAVANALAASTEQVLETTVAQLQSLLGRTPRTHRVVPIGAELRPIGAITGTGTALVLDDHGHVLYKVDFPRSVIPLILARMRRESVYFGPTHIDAGASAGWLWVATNTSGGVGSAAVQLYSNFLADILDNAQIGGSGYTWAVDAGGDALWFPSRVADIWSVGAPRPGRLPQAQKAIASRAASGWTIGRGVKGAKLLSAWAKVPDTGWRIIVEQPASAIFAPLSSKIWKTALLIAAFVLAAIALSILVARRLVRPIKRMQVAAEAIGTGEYGQRIELERRDELGALARAFNSMAERLQELIGGLERVVAERTRQLENASRHKSEFLANMSHELRTPLNAILGFTQVLQQKLFGEVNDKQEEYLGDIHSSANHLLALINDVLDLSKVEAGQVELEKAPFSLREALERGVVMVRERATKNGVSLTLEPSPNTELVTADERRIRQVLFNLLSNAVKFTPSGGSVEVSSAQENGEVLVSVKDTGPGIAEEDQERIFQEFQQTELGQEQREGTGLGLALSRKLVELHGGRIWVESEPGHGSTFTFTLPLEAKA